MQTYKNIKCHIFSNLSFRNHGLLGGRPSLTSVSAPLSQNGSSGDFSGLTPMVQPNPHKSWVQEVTWCQVTTAEDELLGGWSCRQLTVLICQVGPSHKLQNGLRLLTLTFGCLFYSFFSQMNLHCYRSLNLTKSLQPELNANASMLTFITSAK